MVRFDSWRAVKQGNRCGWNLATKSTSGGRATLQAVTRVKLEQASKATMWAPTRRISGEGRVDGENPVAGAHHFHNQHVPIWSTGVVSTANDGRGVANLERHRQEDGPSGRRKGSEVPRKPGNAWGRTHRSRVLTVGREEVRRVPYRKSMSCCTRIYGYACVRAASWTRICRSTSTRSPTPSFCNCRSEDRGPAHAASDQDVVEGAG
jgi:hypothetical protein